MTPAVRLRQAAHRLRTGEANVCRADLDEPLAAWLDLMARIADFAAERGYRTSSQTAAALAVADVILAGDDHA